MREDVEITLSDGHQTHVISWSKRGNPVIFLAGMTHTAFCMEHLASHFLNDFQCVGITRRGFGQSPKGEIDYSHERLVLDIVEILRALNIRESVFIGHSFGCREIELLARDFPDLVQGCVLIDGAYDHSRDFEFLKNFHVAGPPKPSADDLLSIEAIATYTSRTLGVRLPQNELTAMHTFDRHGVCSGRTEDPVAAMKIIAQSETPDWSVLTQPTLAVFAKPNSWDVYAPGILYESEASQVEFARFFDAMTALKESQIREFSIRAPLASICRPEYSNHYLHLSHEWLLASWVRNFLNEAYGL